MRVGCRWGNWVQDDVISKVGGWVEMGWRLSGGEEGLVVLVAWI